MSKSLRTHRNVQYWLPRAWGFAAGGTALLFGALLVSIAFPGEAKRDASSEHEYVYPYEL